MTHDARDGALLTSEQIAAMRTQAQSAIDQLGDDLDYMGIGVPGSMGARDVVRLCDYLTMVHARLAAAERVIEAARIKQSMRTMLDDAVAKVNEHHWFPAHEVDQIDAQVTDARERLERALAAYDDAATPRQDGDAGEGEP